MARVLVGYYSRTKNTKMMAEFVAEGAEEEGADVVLSPVEDINIEDLPRFDAIVYGSPTYYGVMAAEVKDLIDRSVAHHGSLKGKVGGAFSSSAMIGGGNETTIISIIQAHLVHGMVVPGVSGFNHYGPVSIGKPDDGVKEECVEYGKMIARLAKKLSN